MDALRTKGVEFERYDQPGLHSDETEIVNMSGFHAAWFRGPDGNVSPSTIEDLPPEPEVTKGGLVPGISGDRAVLAGRSEQTRSSRLSGPGRGSSGG